MALTQDPTEVAEQTLAGLLEEAIRVEYGALFFLPQYLSQVPSDAARKEVLALGNEELAHFDLTVNLLHRLGGRMTTDLPALYPSPDLETLLSRQVRRELRAIELYAQAQQMVRRDPPAAIPLDDLMRMLQGLEQAEQRHLRLVRLILAEITKG